uniref:HAT C-terminal dimerisation domain-containing protein n=1 Tax=Ditylenchus dipsaci TaxID=166011 RepID=A0A915CQ58_9BILA
MFEGKTLSKHELVVENSLKGEEAGQFLFSKHSSSEATCNNYFIRGTGDLSTLDRKIMHLVACQNLPFAIVVAETFSPILAKDLLKEEQKSLKRIQEKVDDRGNIFECGEEVRSPPPKRTSSFFGQLSHLFVDEEGFNDEQVSSAMIDLSSYTKQRCIDPEADPLQYCKDNEKSSAILAKIAQRYLSPLATSQLSEQLFSVAIYIYDYRRSNLKPKKAEMLIFLNKNLSLLSFSVSVVCPEPSAM